jgi:hypothetical protein
VTELLEQFWVGADRDGTLTLEHTHCWVGTEAQNWTIRQLIDWATAHTCPPKLEGDS